MEYENEDLIDCLRSNPELTLAELANRLAATLGIDQPDHSELQNRVERLIKEHSATLRRVATTPPTYSYIHNDNLPFQREYELYLPLQQWLSDSLQVKAEILSAQTARNQGRRVNLWRYPDLVGYRRLSTSLQVGKLLAMAREAEYRFYSFEVKRMLEPGNLRESFFQTLANSAWANYRYLVTAHIAEECIEPLRQLSKSYGVGVIRLDVALGDDDKLVATDRARVEIESPLYPLDLEAIEELASESSGWSDFRNWIGSLP